MEWPGALQRKSWCCFPLVSAILLHKAVILHAPVLGWLELGPGNGDSNLKLGCLVRSLSGTGECHPSLLHVVLSVQNCTYRHELEQQK